MKLWRLPRRVTNAISQSRALMKESFYQGPQSAPCCFVFCFVLSQDDGVTPSELFFRDRHAGSRVSRRKPMTFRHTMVTPSGGADAPSDTGRLVRRNFTYLPHPQGAVFSFLKTDVKRGTEGTVKKKYFSQVLFCRPIGLTRPSSLTLTDSKNQELF